MPRSFQSRGAHLRCPTILGACQPDLRLQGVPPADAKCDISRGTRALETDNSEIQGTCPGGTIAYNHVAVHQLLCPGPVARLVAPPSQCSPMPLKNLEARRLRRADPPLQIAVLRRLVLFRAERYTRTRGKRTGMGRWCTVASCTWLVGRPQLCTATYLLARSMWPTQPPLSALPAPKHAAVST